MKLRSLLALASIVPLAAVACSSANPSVRGIEVGTSEEELIVTHLPDVLATPLPDGFGTYCSSTDSAGNWALGQLGPGGDPCGDMAKQGVGGVVKRAGYWSTKRTNNVLVTCDGLVYMYRGTGTDPIDWAFNAVNVAGTKNCIFTIAPLALPMFGSPIAMSGVSMPSVFNYDAYMKPWKPTMFGQTADSTQASSPCGSGKGTPGDPANPTCTTDASCGSGKICRRNAPWDPKTCINPRCAGVTFDRTGKERAFATTCSSDTNVWDCNQQSEGGSIVSNEGAYDWSLPAGTKLIAVADGIVRGSTCRDVHDNGGGAAGDCQEELFIESQIGTGTYAEHVIAAYHHMDWNGKVYKDSSSIWHPLPPVGHIVHRGDVVGIVGNSGTSSPPGQNIHLDFSVTRLTNLTGARFYWFHTQPTSYGTCNTAADCGETGYTCTGNHNCQSFSGVNGYPGLIDPYGWAAPQQIDPGAWMFLGFKSPFGNDQVPDNGAFSINLFRTPGTFDWPLPPTVGPVVY